jgi:hypothetical protein
MITRYEQLRRQALSESVNRKRVGWALFVRRGMAEWMRAWWNTTSWEEVVEENEAHDRETDVRDSAGILPPLAAEITTVLAGMALSYLRSDSAILSGDSR